MMCHIINEQIYRKRQQKLFDEFVVRVTGTIADIDSIRRI